MPKILGPTPINLRKMSRLNKLSLKLFLLLLLSRLAKAVGAARPYSAVPKLGGNTASTRFALFLNSVSFDLSFIRKVH